jgi:hypothetical protein
MWKLALALSPVPLADSGCGSAVAGAGESYGRFPNPWESDTLWSADAPTLPFVHLDRVAARRPGCRSCRRCERLDDAYASGDALVPNQQSRRFGPWSTSYC